MHTIELNEREKQILKLVCSGLNNEQIAQMLCISTHTVKAYVAAIMTKLKLN